MRSNYVDTKAALIEMLREIPDRDTKTIVTGGRTFTVNELIDEVSQDTEIGRSHVAMYGRELREDEEHEPD